MNFTVENTTETPTKLGIPNYISSYLINKGFYIESDKTLSFIPTYQWEKFSLSITDCNHYRFEIFGKDDLLPKRTIFTGFRITTLNELEFLLSHNSDFSNIWEKL